MKQDPKYILVNKCADGTTMVRIIDDPTEVFMNAQYDEKNGDKLYQLGQEVKIKISVEPAAVYRTTVRKEDVVGMKGDLGVGDYRG